MTPKEKAEEIYQEYLDIIYVKNQKIINPINGSTIAYYNNIAKQCALIAVDEILKNYYKNHFQKGKKIDYWQEVKNEIEKY
jgi:hypothetical protein